MTDGRVTIGEKFYIPAKRIAEITGHTENYVIRLAKFNKFSGKKIGQVWYIDKESFWKFWNAFGEKTPDATARQKFLPVARSTELVVMNTEKKQRINPKENFKDARTPPRVFLFATATLCAMSVIVLSSVAFVNSIGLQNQALVTNATTMSANLLSADVTKSVDGFVSDYISTTNIILNKFLVSASNGLLETISFVNNTSQLAKSNLFPKNTMTALQGFTVMMPANVLVANFSSVSNAFINFSAPESVASIGSSVNPVGQGNNVIVAYVQTVNTLLNNALGTLSAAVSQETENLRNVPKNLVTIADSLKNYGQENMAAVASIGENLVVNSLTSTTEYVNTVTAETITTQNLSILPSASGLSTSGITISDRSTGKSTCIYVENNEIKETSGACASGQR